MLGFLDDDPGLQRQFLIGKKIFNPSKLKSLSEENYINLILLAIPSIGKLKKSQIIKNINKHKIVVKTLPSVSQIIDGRVTISDIKDLNVEDLLERDETKADNKLLSRNINSKTVLVTGAGGSIGSELSRQIMKIKTK